MLVEPNMWLDEPNPEIKPITVLLTKMGLPLTDPMPLLANWVLEDLPCQERHFRLRLKLRRE